MHYVLLLNAQVQKDPIKYQESIVDETWAILKNSINFHRKMPMKKVSLVNNSYIFEPILILSTLFRSAVCLLLNAKSTTDPKKHQESIVDETWAILKNSINFHTKKQIKKGSFVNNWYIFNRFLFWQRSHVVQYGLLSNANI